MSWKRSNLTSIKKMCKVLDMQELLCVWVKHGLSFLWCDNQTSYLFFFSSQKATARTMRTPRMQAITTETTKPSRREKTCRTVTITALRGEGESLVCHSVSILHLQPFCSLVTPLWDCGKGNFARVLPGMSQSHSWTHSSQWCDMRHTLKSQRGGTSTAGQSRNMIFVL